MKKIAFFLFLILLMGFKVLMAQEGVFERCVSFYQNYISPLDMSECPSYPRCSEYSKQVVKKHGFIIGVVMIVDRLFHEGKEELEVSKTLIRDGKVKIYDPPENNDFWWYGNGDP